MTTADWTDNQDTICEDYTAEHADQECPKFHPGCDDEQPFYRFAFWENANKRLTYYKAVLIEDFVIEVTDMGPYERGDCTVKDLVTKATMDAAEFLSQFAKHN